LPVKAFVVPRFHLSRCLARVWPSELMPRTAAPGAALSLYLQL